jgi:inner membrane protein COX18
MRAWAARVNHELAKIRLQQQQQQNEMMSTNDIAVWGLKYRTANLAEKKRRFRRWGVQSWKDWVPSLVVFPLWITGIEGLRRMCGGPRGLLGRMVFGNGEAPEGRDEAGVTGAAVQGMGGGEGEIGEALVGSLSGLDPSLATGGCLWFPDLTAADPYHVLPFALSAVLLLNLLRTAHTGMGIRSLFNLAEKNQIVLVQNKWRLRVQRALLMVAVAVGPMTMDLPAALHLYWICSAALTGVQTEIIARLMPMPKTVTPAKRNQAVELVRPTREGTKKP